MYKITETLEVGLNKVTPRALMGLKTLKLYDTELGVGEDVRLILELFIDEVKIKTFLEIIFNGVKEYDWNALDLSEVVRGYRDFFGQLSGNSLS